MLMPGLRVGFIVADGPVYDSLVKFKRVNDLATSTLVQRALEAYVTVGRYQAHLRRSCRVYKKRRDAMIDAIDRYLPVEVHFDRPQGGLFVWLQLPDRLSSDALLEHAHEQGVDFSPGSVFYIDGAEGSDKLRLNFTAQPLENIEEGIRRLGKALRDCARNKAVFRLICPETLQAIEDDGGRFDVGQVTRIGDCMEFRLRMSFLMVSLSAKGTVVSSRPQISMIGRCCSPPLHRRP